MAKVILGLIGMLVGVALGIYVGLWLMFIGGILGLISAVASLVAGATVGSILGLVGFSILKIMLAGLAGYVSMAFVAVPSYALMLSGLK